MRLLIVDNISSGDGNTRIFDFIRAFSRDGDEIVMRISDSTTPVQSLVSDAADFDAVVAAGGDGTVSSVMYELRGTGIPILPYPSGTTNLITQNLDAPLDPYAYARMVRDLNTLDFDMGEIDINGEKTGFSMIAGAGFDATIMESAAKLKENFGENAYFMAALGNINASYTNFKLTLDDKVIETRGIAVLLINFGRIQFDISLAPDTDPRDGLLEVMVLKMSRPIQLIPGLIDAIRARRDRGKNVDVYLAKEVVVEADPAVTIQFDGEPTGVATPLHARSLRRQVRLIVDMESERIQGYVRHDAKALRETAKYF